MLNQATDSSKRGPIIDILELQKIKWPQRQQDGQDNSSIVLFMI
jgi:hypothetical protein